MTLTPSGRATASSRLFNWSVSYKDVAVSISMASLVLVREWGAADLIRSSRGRYFLTGPPGLVLETYALLNTAAFASILVLLIGFFITGRARAGLHASYRLPAVAGCLILLNAAVALARQVSASLDLSNALASRAPYAVIVLVGLLSLGLLSLCVARWARRTWAVIEAVALIFLPFTVLRVGQVAWHLVSPHGQAPGALGAAVVGHGTPPKPLVLWLIFDEMDQLAVSGELFGHLDLPNLALLRQTSVHLEHACEAADETLNSIPTLTVGQQVQSVRWENPDDLMLRFEESGTYVPWSSQRTLFHEAKELARHTAVLGYFHPYCRLFGRLVDACQVAPYPAPYSWIEWWGTLEAAQPHEALLLQADHALSAFPVVRSPDGRFLRPSQKAVQAHIERQHLAAASLLRRSLLDLLSKPQLDFVFAHIPLPHPPGVPHLIGFGGKPVHERGYVGNLQATDYLLGEIWELLRSSGRWNASAIVLTSDHAVRDFWRSSLSISPSLLKVIDSGGERSVPLLVKLPAQTEAVGFLEPIDAGQVHGIVGGLLRGEFKRPAELVAYLHQRAAEKPCAVRRPGR